MSFYEFIVIIRQDVSSSEVDKIVSEFSEIIKSYNGEVIKVEYWGIRQLAYEISNNKKGHYYFMGIKADNELLAELNRKQKLKESIIRASIIRTNEIETGPSPLLKTEGSDNAETIIDVTVNKTHKGTYGNAGAVSASNNEANQ